MVVRPFLLLANMKEKLLSVEGQQSLRALSDRLVMALFPLAGFSIVMPCLFYVFHVAWLTVQVANPNFLFFSNVVAFGAFAFFIAELVRGVVIWGRCFD